jgi:hypothetical protein
MATELPSARAPTSSLTAQIIDAERRLQSRRRLVGVRGVALRRTVQEWMTKPTTLLWAGGMGFLIGELTQPIFNRFCRPPAPEPRFSAAMARAVQAGSGT